MPPVSAADPRRFHFVLPQPMDVEARRRDAAAGTAPRHFFLDLAARLEARVHAPEKSAPGPVRRHLVHRILKTPDAIIDLAGRVVEMAGEHDVIFCLSESVCLPIAHALRRQGKKTKLASFGHNLDRPRIRATRLLAGLPGRVDLFFVFTRAAVRDRRKYVLYLEQTDDGFFRADPGPLTAARKASDRPLLISVGLEMRDNVALAEATKDLPVDVRITAFSKDAAPTGRAVPQPLPANMTAQFYPWRDLVDLYTAADIVVVPVCPASYAAGINGILEAAAVGKPVIATATPALQQAFADPGSIAWVPPEDPGALKQAITALLDDPPRRAEMAARAAVAVKVQHGFAPTLERMAAALEAM